MRLRQAAPATAAIVLGLLAAACSAGGAAPGPGAAPARHRPPKAEHLARKHVPIKSPATATGPFGTGCASLPRHGPGSRKGIAAVPVGTAIEHTPQLSELAHAFELAGLTRMLNSAPSLTVFAPDNAAFRLFGTGNLQALLTTRSDLVRVLKFQVVAGRVTPARLARPAPLTTIAGTKLDPTKAGTTFDINNASVSCGNLRTANATVYIVDKLVVPAT